MKRTEEIFRHVLNQERYLLESTRDDMNPEAFDLAVAMIARARRVYIIGVRACAPLAQYLAFYLNQATPDVHLIRTDSSAEIFEQMLYVREKDVVIGISFPQYSLRVLRALEFANSRNAGIITLTDSVHSPICLYSSCNLVAHTEMSSVVSSMTAPLSVINALAAALCAKNKKIFKNNLQERDRVSQDFPGYPLDETTEKDNGENIRSGEMRV